MANTAYPIETSGVLLAFESDLAGLCVADIAVPGPMLQQALDTLRSTIATLPPPRDCRDLSDRLYAVYAASKLANVDGSVQQDLVRAAGLDSLEPSWLADAPGALRLHICALAQALIGQTPDLREELTWLLDQGSEVRGLEKAFEQDPVATLMAVALVIDAETEVPREQIAEVLRRGVTSPDLLVRACGLRAMARWSEPPVEEAHVSVDSIASELQAWQPHRSGVARATILVAAIHEFSVSSEIAGDSYPLAPAKLSDVSREIERIVPELSGRVWELACVLDGLATISSGWSLKCSVAELGQQVERLRSGLVLVHQSRNEFDRTRSRDILIAALEAAVGLVLVASSASWLAFGGGDAFSEVAGVMGAGVTAGVVALVANALWRIRRVLGLTELVRKF